MSMALFSVPQGSCAKPILYLLHVSTITEVVPTPLDLHGYVDDHWVKDKCKAEWNNKTIEVPTIWKLESYLDSIHMDGHKPSKMNSSKTEFILFGSKWQLQMCITNSIKVNGAEVK